MAGVDGLTKIPELRKRILFALAMLAVYRLGVHVPTPGIDSGAIANHFQTQQGTLFGVFNMFTGGALARMSVFALGVMPYISASIIFSLLTGIYPALEEIQKEGDSGRKKISQWTRYLTVVLCCVQGFGIAMTLENWTLITGGSSVVLHPGLPFRLMTVLTLTAGTIFLMWLGEQITERGIGNGMSLIIFAGIAAQIPTGISSTWALFRSGELSPFHFLFLLVLIVGLFGLIVFLERGARRVPVQYAKRVVGRKVAAAQNSHLPLKLNITGVIPPIFASAIIMFPATIANFVQHPILQDISQNMRPGNLLYDVFFIGLIVFFCYFYIPFVFKPDDVAENLKKSGGFVPGIRPGKRTSEFLEYILIRITLGGAVYIAAVCVIPTGILSKMNVPFLSGIFNGTSLLILVGVAMDTVSQIQSHMLQRNYDGFMKGTKMRGRGRKAF